MRDEDRRILYEDLQRIEKALAAEVLKSYARVSPSVFWTHVEGLRRILELTDKLRPAQRRSRPDSPS